MNRRVGQLSLVSVVLIIVSLALVVGLVSALAVSDRGQRGDVRVVVPGVTRDGEVEPPAATVTPTQHQPSATQSATSTASATGTATVSGTGVATASATGTSVGPTAGSTAPTQASAPVSTATLAPTQSASATSTLPGATPTPTPQDLPRFELTVKDGAHQQIITVQVAATSQQRQVGLMWVTDLPQDEGMLFLFDSDSSNGFWMRNTYIPLDIAYIDSDRIVIEVKHGTPLDETSLRPSSPYRYVLEMNAGWFAANGFGPGSEIILPAGLPDPQ